MFIGKVQMQKGCLLKTWNGKAWGRSRVSVCLAFGKLLSNKTFGKFIGVDIGSAAKPIFHWDGMDNGLEQKYAVLFYYVAKGDIDKNFEAATDKAGTMGAEGISV